MEDIFKNIKKINPISWCHEFDFLISRNRLFDNKNIFFFYFKKLNWFLDIKKSKFFGIKKWIFWYKIDFLISRKTEEIVKRLIIRRVFFSNFSRGDKAEILTLSDSNTFNLPLYRLGGAESCQLIFWNTVFIVFDVQMPLYIEGYFLIHREWESPGNAIFWSKITLKSSIKNIL